MQHAQCSSLRGHHSCSGVLIGPSIGHPACHTHRHRASPAAAATSPLSASCRLPRAPRSPGHGASHFGARDACFVVFVLAHAALQALTACFRVTAWPVARAVRLTAGTTFRHAILLQLHAPDIDASRLWCRSWRWMSTSRSTSLARARLILRRSIILTATERPVSSCSISHTSPNAPRPAPLPPALLSPPPSPLPRLPAHVRDAALLPLGRLLKPQISQNPALELQI